MIQTFSLNRWRAGRLATWLVGAPLSLLTLTSCTTAPAWHDDELTTTDIVLNVKCELRDAVWRIPPQLDWMEKWDAKVTLQMVVFQRGGGGGDANYNVPLVLPGIFRGNIEANISSEAQRDSSVGFFEKIARLNGFEYCPTDSSQHDRRRLLESRLGIRDWLERVSLARAHTEINPADMTYEVRFVIRKNGEVGARFLMIPVGSNIFNGGVKLEGRRNKTHVLTIALAHMIKGFYEPEIKAKVDNTKRVEILEKELRRVRRRRNEAPEKVKSLETELRRVRRRRGATTDKDEIQQLVKDEKRINAQLAEIEQLPEDEARVIGQLDEASRPTRTLTLKTRPPPVGPTGVNEATRQQLDNIQAQQTLRAILNKIDTDRLLP